MTVTLFLLMSVGVSLVSTPVVMWVARTFHCIDHPVKRSVHTTPTPLLGGLAVAVGALPELLFLQLDPQVVSYFIAAAMLLIIGCIDDWKALGWKVKLCGMLVAISIIIYMGDIVVRDLGLFGINKKVTLDLLSIPFTFMCIVGVTNAINLIDGLNGLAGGVSLIAFVFLGIGGLVSGELTLSLICFAYAGALLGFLAYNFPKGRIFMGDSGSLFLGFSLSVIAILLTQGGHQFVTLEPILTEEDLAVAALSERVKLVPMFPVLVLLLPIFDTLRVMTVRLFLRKSPFEADKLHLHHILIRRGFSMVATTLIMWALACGFGLVAVFLTGRSSTTYLFTVLVSCLIMSLAADALARNWGLKNKKSGRNGKT